jgi:hypothetical protein
MPNILSLTEVRELSDCGDFFRPSTEYTDQKNNPDLFSNEPKISELSSVPEEPDMKDGEPVKDPEDMEKKNTNQPSFYSDADEYVCQNPNCKYLNNRDQLTEIHVYEINGNHTVNICNDCYYRGYRFCLFTHDVLHLDTLDPVLESCPPDTDQDTGLMEKQEYYYAHKNRHHGQLNPSILAQVDDLIEYFKMIGLENPCPSHTIIDLTIAPVFDTETD